MPGEDARLTVNLITDMALEVCLCVNMCLVMHLMHIHRNASAVVSYTHAFTPSIIDPSHLNPLPSLIFSLSITELLSYPLLLSLCISFS